LTKISGSSQFSVEWILQKYFRTCIPEGWRILAGGKSAEADAAPGFSRKIRRPERAREITAQLEVSITSPGQIQFPVWPGGCAQSLSTAIIRPEQAGFKYVPVVPSKTATNQTTRKAMHIKHLHNSNSEICAPFPNHKHSLPRRSLAKAGTRNTQHTVLPHKP